MPIYTKKGDKGETGLPGGRRLPKADLIFEFLGNLDLTNSSVGLTASLISDRKITKQLQTIQSNFLTIGAFIAAQEGSRSKIDWLDKDVTALEHQIDQWDKVLPELKNFILPGGSQASSAAHINRSTVRQAERAFHRLNLDEEFGPIARYLNRLSDYFFQLARFLNHQAKKADIVWRSSRNIS